MQAPVINISEFQADHLDTERSTAQTVKKMGQHVRDAVQDPEVMRAAVDSVVDAGPRSQVDICRCVWAWLKSHIRFVPDEVQLEKLLGRGDELELLISPSVMVRPELLGGMQGDCDCFTMMGCSMLACLGIQPLIKTFKCDRREPWRWSHVCAAGRLDDGSIFPCDASHGDYPGWQVPLEATFESCLWDMNGNKVGGDTMRGMNAYQSAPGWTGNPMTASQGVGPYPQLDVMRYWYQQKRLKGLQGIARGKYGLGDDSTSYDPGTPTNPLLPLQTVNLPGSAFVDSNGNYVDYSGQTTTSGLPTSVSSSGSGIDLNTLLAQLLGAGTQIGKQALLPAGAVLLPNGTIGYANTAGQNPLTASSLTQYLPLLAVVGVGILALSMLKK
jgi:hypothetical protein